MRCALAGLALMLSLFVAPTRLWAQAEAAIRIETIELFISRAQMRPARLWDLYVSQRGLAFEVDAGAEARLRVAGADNEMIAMLRRATVHAAKDGTSVPSTQIEPQFTRGELRWVYFDRRGALIIYVSSARLREVTGQVNDWTISTASGDVRLNSPRLTFPAVFGGIDLRFRDYGLAIEGHFQKDLMMLFMGASYEPFLPVGATGLRAIVGVTPLVGTVRQTLGHVPQQPVGENRTSIELHNGVLGADGRVGMAYHFKPGAWIYAELDYRWLTTIRRSFDVPGEAGVTKGIPWSKWRATGSMIRVGVGW